MKTIKFIAITIAVLLVITVFLPLVAMVFFPGAGYLLAHLGMGAIILGSVRPDRNLDYRITLSLPDGRNLEFSGKTGCEHRSDMLGARYWTMNRISTLVDKNEKWILYGINCNSVLKGRPRPRYELYRIDSDKVAYRYFVIDGTGTKIVNYSFDPSFTLSIDKKETGSHDYNYGPYYYRKLKLSNVPWREPSDKKNKVVYVNETCGRKNENSKKIQISEEGVLKNKHIEKYSTGTLKATSDYESWAIDDPINIEKPLMVLKTEYEAGTRIPKSGPPPGCVWFNYQGNRYLLSESSSSSSYSGASLYLPKEKSVIQVRRIHDTAMRSILEYKQFLVKCEKPYSIDNIEINEVIVDHQKKRLVKYDGSKYLCSKPYNLTFKWF